MDPATAQVPLLALSAGRARCHAVPNLDAARSQAEALARVAREVDGTAGRVVAPLLLGRSPTLPDLDPVAIRHISVRQAQAVIPFLPAIPIDQAIVPRPFLVQASIALPRLQQIAICCVSIRQLEARATLTL